MVIILFNTTECAHSLRHKEQKSEIVLLHDKKESSESLETQQTMTNKLQSGMKMHELFDMLYTFKLQFLFDSKGIHSALMLGKMTKIWCLIIDHSY